MYEIKKLLINNFFHRFEFIIHVWRGLSKSLKSRLSSLNCILYDKIISKLLMLENFRFYSKRLFDYIYV